MSDKKETVTTPEAEAVISSAKGFWEKNSKVITYVGSAVILLIAGWYSYVNFYKLPKENAAKDMVFSAEKLFDQMAGSGFNKDSVNIVLNGGNLEGTPVTGLLKVISQYGSTETANRARYMAGACYLQIGEFQKAVKYLEEFKGNGADQVQSRAYIMLGHANAELKKTGEALKFYQKAATVNEKDEAMTSDALMLSASYAKAIGQTKEAIDLLTRLKDKYPTSTVVANGEVDKQLASLGQLN